jgi:hypothetical protein
LRRSRPDRRGGAEAASRTDSKETEELGKKKKAGTQRMGGVRDADVPSREETVETQHARAAKIHRNGEETRFPGMNDAAKAVAKCELTAGVKKTTGKEVML